MPVGDAANPLRVAIIGSGPSGFYAAEHLLSQDDLNVQVDMFDRLPTPFGLVRGGVAPDHQKIKSVTRVFDRVAAHPEFRFRGNVELGRHIEQQDVLEYFHAVIYAVGASSDRRMGIPHEYLPGSHSGSEFVGWYNANPGMRSLTYNLTGPRAVVVGNGNVAMDISRMLVLPHEDLVLTDMGRHAVRALQAGGIREVVMLGRRGPAQAAFTPKELREVTERDDIDVIVDPADMVLDENSRKLVELAPDRNRDQNLELLGELAERGDRGRDRRIILRFLASPVAIVGTEHVEGIEVARNELYRSDRGALRARMTAEREIIPTGLVFRAIGYQGEPLAGVPFDPMSATIPNDRGRVVDPLDGQPRPGQYAAGWIKRGPSGIIGTNKPDAQETVDSLLEDLRAGHLERAVPARPVLARLLRERQGDLITYADWQYLDEVEKRMGADAGAPRIKFGRVENMLRSLRNRDRGTS